MVCTEARLERLNGFITRPFLGEAARHSEARVRALRAELQIAASHGMVHGFWKCKRCSYLYTREPWRVFPYIPGVDMLRDPHHQNSGYGTRFRDPERRKGSPGFRMKPWNSRKTVSPKRWYIVCGDEE